MNLTSFFETYERNSNGEDAVAVVSQFADPFLSAGPDGAVLVSGAHFALALQRRKRWFEDAGCKASSLVGKAEKPLDARYTLVTTRWRIECAPYGARAFDLEVDSTFLVDTGGEEPKILLYLAHQDLGKELNNRRAMGQCDGPGADGSS